MTICPLMELLTHLDDGEMPTLEWVVRVSRGGAVDPLRGARQTAREVYALWQVIGALGDERFKPAAYWYSQGCHHRMVCDDCSHDPLDICENCCDETRARVDINSLPTLIDFILIYRNKRGIA